MTALTLYTREGCCLCDEALAVLERVRASAPFELRVRDIESDDELLARYLERIPVVAHGTQEWFELEVGEAELRERLARVAGA